MPNGSLLPTGRIKERDWLTAFACRIVIRPRGRTLRYAEWRRTWGSVVFFG